MGGALKTPQTIEGVPVVGIGETVHDLPTVEDQEEPLQPSLEIQDLPDSQKVIEKEDIIGVKAAIIYENCLRQLVTSLILPVKRCTGDLRTGVPCNSAGPFHVNIMCKATAMIVEWVSVLMGTSYFLYIIVIKNTAYVSKESKDMLTLFLNLFWIFRYVRMVTEYGDGLHSLF